MQQLLRPQRGRVHTLTCNPTPTPTPTPTLTPTPTPTSMLPPLSILPSPPFRHGVRIVLEARARVLRSCGGVSRRPNPAYTRGRGACMCMCRWTCGRACSATSKSRCMCNMGVMSKILTHPQVRAHRPLPKLCALACDSLGSGSLTCRVRPAPATPAHPLPPGADNCERTMATRVCHCTAPDGTPEAEASEVSRVPARRALHLHLLAAGHCHKGRWRWQCPRQWQSGHGCGGGGASPASSSSTHWL